MVIRSELEPLKVHKDLSPYPWLGCFWIFRSAWITLGFSSLPNSRNRDKNCLWWHRSALKECSGKNPCPEQRSNQGTSHYYYQAISSSFQICCPRLILISILSTAATSVKGEFEIVSQDDLWLFGPQASQICSNLKYRRKMNIVVRRQNIPS